MQQPRVIPGIYWWCDNWFPPSEPARTSTSSFVDNWDHLKCIRQTDPNPHMCVDILLCFELVLVEFWWSSLKSVYESVRAWLNQNETWLGEWSLWKFLTVPFEWFGSLSPVPLCFWSYSTNSPFSCCPLGVSLCPQSPLWHGSSTPSSLLRTREHCQALRPELSQRPPMPCLHGRWLGTEECLPLDGFRWF